MSSTGTSVSTTTSVKPRAKAPSLLACIPCRKSHLKCDGQRPLCSRCADRKGGCFWVDSRRGYREFRRSQGFTDERREGQLTADEILPEPQSQSQSIATPAQNGTRGWEEADTSRMRAAITYQELFAADSALITDPFGYQNAPLDNLIPTSSPSNKSDSTMSITRDPNLALVDPAEVQSHELIELFYKHFYPAHPFIVPRKMYLESPSSIPPPLRAVIRYVASHFLPHANRVALANAAKIILSDDVPDDGYKVQGLLLYAFVCYARFDGDSGAAGLEKAVETAIRIGMNRASFAIQYGENNPTLQESWRRTWWMLLIIEGLIAVIGGQQQPFRTYSTPTDVPLPGPEEDYDELRTSSQPRSLADLRNRAFSEETYEFSSFDYAIEASYILGSVLNLAADTFAVTDPQVEAIDASISNFFLSLPLEQREVIRHDGTVDECLVVAHIIINWAALGLHRPRSTLTFIRNHYRTTCTKPEAAGLPALTYASHTAKALRAANNITNLASIQRPLSDCTPVLMCALTAAATVHLPAYAIVERADQAMAIKERLQLIVSALGSFGQFWPRAIVARGQVAKFAREVLTKPNIFVDSSSSAMVPQLESDAGPQLAYQLPFNNDVWVDHVLHPEQNADGQLACPSLGSLYVAPAQAQGV
ncbi:hypothetical protein A1O3_02460 [Capronia epimyces CBS 606.96]|uniref:Zn(2)-C6 fungal-type domain-containing protein n=1 Tax=Capronia epimyces CBS 606.96 TaxID=1182542 RepID=W9YA79_9EURO|nr:uncharacterized protein A1O3_02460 [Capronia epimyces CBS 606.96]EXJ89393.1 hypothetical protein A1O3_02460 [Capronia epimyces CBS 606.96]